MNASLQLLEQLQVLGCDNIRSGS